MKAPQCLNPQHPSDQSRDSMILLEETSEHYVFGCAICKEFNKKLAVQVRTKPAFRQHIAEQPAVKMRKAEVVRKRLGKITYFR